jgi:hypothetical protein
MGPCRGRTSDQVVQGRVRGRSQGAAVLGLQLLQPLQLAALELYSLRHRKYYLRFIFLHDTSLLQEEPKGADQCVRRQKAVQ